MFFFKLLNQDDLGSSWLGKIPPTMNECNNCYEVWRFGDQFKRAVVMEPIMKAEKQSNNQQVTETERHTDTAPKSIKKSEEQASYHPTE